MVEFHVLRCSDCQTFQVLQVTKSQKWKCKLCGQKQSVIKVYGRGTGADCRKHVQKLNTLRGEIDLAKEEASFFTPMPSPLSVENNLSANRNVGSTSQWLKFVDAPCEQVSDDEDKNEAVDSGTYVTTDRTLLEAKQKQIRNNKRKMSHGKDYESMQYSSIEKKYHQLEPHETMDNRIGMASRSSSKGDFTSAPNRASSHVFNPLTKRNTNLSFLNDPRNSARCKKENSQMDEHFSTRTREITDNQPIKNIKLNKSSAQSELAWTSNVNFSSNNNDAGIATANSSVRVDFEAQYNLKANKCKSTSKPSKWASFLEEDQEETFNSDEDETEEFNFNDYGQLTVCLSENITAKSFLRQ